MVVVVLKRELRDVYKPAHVAHSSVQSNALTARVQKNHLRIFFRWIERNSIAPAVKRVIDAQELRPGIIAKAARPVSLSRIRVGNSADRCIVVSGPLSAAVRPEQPVLQAIFNPGAAAALVVVRASYRGEVASQAGVSRLVA